jgi:serine/threonine-protein kinase
VLYELLTGTRPFAGGPLQAVMYRVLSEPPMPLDVAAPGLPARLNDIVMRALAKEPEKRYLTALAMANDLLSVRASLDGGASSPGTVSLRATIESALDERRTSQFKRVRRRRIAFSGAGVAAAAVLVLSGWFLARRSLAAPGSAPTPGLAGSVGSPASGPARAVPSDPPPPQSPASPSATQAQTDRPRQSPSNKGDRRASLSATPADQRAQARPAPPKPSDAVSLPPPSVAPANATQPVVSPATNGGAASGAVPTSAASSTAPPVNAAPPNTTGEAATEIGNVIDAYARAIESRDMSQLRRVYSTITGDQANAFSDFFSSTRALRAVLAVNSVQVDGNKATARVAGTYEFTTTAGRAQQQPVTFQAELRHDGGSWKLVAVR